METTVGIAGGLIIGVLLTLAGSYYLFVLQRARKVLEWEILSSTPIVTSPQDNPHIQVIVSPALLGNSWPMGDDENIVGQNPSWRPIREFRTFRIRVKNTGNQVLEELWIRFSLAGEARVVSLEEESIPNLGEQSITTEIQSQSPASSRAFIPFLNPHDEAIFSLQAVNASSERCEVSVGAPGLTVKETSHFWANTLAPASLGSITTLVAGLIAALLASLFSS